MRLPFLKKKKGLLGNKKAPKMGACQSVDASAAASVVETARKVPHAKPPVHNEKHVVQNRKYWFLLISVYFYVLFRNFVM